MARLAPQPRSARRPPRHRSRTTTGGRRFPAEVLTDDEVRRLMAACKGPAFTVARHRALIALLYRGGLRISEALRLCPKDVDLGTGAVRVLWGKGGRARTVGVDPGGLALVAAWAAVRAKARTGASAVGRGNGAARGPGGGANGPVGAVAVLSAPGDHAPLFCTRAGMPLSTGWVRRLMPRLARRAGILKRVHAHGLRHTHAAQLRAEGIDIAVIRRQLGHASLVTTVRYLDHLAPTDGLGQRIWFHADEDADGTVEASNDDPRYNYVYDDRWRIVAVYRVPYSGSDTTPKETYVWHMAGMDGRGGSSYIDTVILRDRDNTNGWTGAPDGTLEERRFYLQNWRADVSAVCNTNGRPLERVKYSAYGVPITLTELDFNLDGNIDPDDPSDFIGAPDDWDLDGDTDASDSTNFAADYGVVSGNTYGRAVLSLEGVRNILGYAGYVGDRFIRGSGSSATEGGQGFKWHVRHRVLDSGIGRWTRRDPLGYVDDAANLHQYAENDPINKADADGLDAGTCTLGTYVVCSAAAAPAGPVLICCTFIVVPVAAGCAGYSIGCYIRDNLMPGPVNLPPLPRSTPPPSNITYYGRCLAMYLAYKAACALCSRCNGTTSPTVACTMAACWMNCAIMRSAFTATACPNANSPGHKQAVFDAFGAAGNCYSRCIVSD